MIRLRVLSDDGDVHRTFRGNTVVIGRSKTSDLSLPEGRGLSRFHCRLTLRDGSCTIEDLGARHCTRVNDTPVREGVVREGDELRLGQVAIVVEAIRDTEATEELVRPCLHCGHLFSAGSDACPRCGNGIVRRRKTRTIGDLTFPGYRIVRKIGSGGMGIVFEAEDLEKGRQVALKVLRPYLARNVQYLARFIEEIRVLTSIRHKGIVQIYGRGREGDLHYLTMEFVDGRSARDYLRGQGRLPWPEAVRIAWEAAKALNAAHQQAGVVHGDVKPGNFLLDARGDVKICDFGLAAVELGRRASLRHDREEHRRGTAAYAAPERFESGSEPSVRGDIYSLGVAIFQMVTGRLPYQGGSVQALCEQHQRAEIPLIDEVEPTANPALRFLLERMLAKDPARRFPDYPALLSDLSLLQ